MSIDQTGFNVIIIIRAKGGHDIEGAFGSAKSMKGTFDGTDLFFETQPLHGPSITFHGSMKNGLIAGTSEVGVSWFAMRHFD
ncbi:hypothetical protein SAMN05421771_2060 [Granulicella pectinivorans]|uniref:Uncharacterized protein n=1 Tax=Granulicella pectinivorans TaxID=474950 RepID=A0A1I6M8Y9_9BACT|nr:hypothetical protein [Granulicella pectinivorans]SFS12078.1 hypothetical protein SAMN05421771_2060 [Granulicella pectinivorans]